MKKIIYSFLALLFTLSFTVGSPIKDTNADGLQVAAENAVQTPKSGEGEQAICAVSPYEGEYVFLTNDRMTEWLKTYLYGSTIDVAVEEKLTELYYPKESITISWEDKNDCDYYMLFLDTKEDFSTAQKYLVTTTKREMTNLYVCKDYYWRVVGFKNNAVSTTSDIFHFITTSTPRTIYIDGLSNTRDVGGYMTSFGKQVKQGMVYRCALPEDITELGKKQATEIYGIKTELDLRGLFAFQKDPDSSLYAGMAAEELCQSYVENGSPFGESVTYKYFWAPHYVGGTNGLNDNYTDAVKTTEPHANDYQFVKIMKEFTKEENYPIIFHCSLGRDRTGTLACMLNALLGVADEDLHIDYETSFFSIRATPDKPYVPSFVSSFESIIGYLYSFEGTTLADKTANYLMTYGMTQEEIDTIRKIMLED